MGHIISPEDGTGKQRPTCRALFAVKLPQHQETMSGADAKPEWWCPRTSFPRRPGTPPEESGKAYAPPRRYCTTRPPAPGEGKGRMVLHRSAHHADPGGASAEGKVRYQLPVPRAHRSRGRRSGGADAGDKIERGTASPAVCNKGGRLCRSGYRESTCQTRWCSTFDSHNARNSGKHKIFYYSEAQPIAVLRQRRSNRSRGRHRCALLHRWRSRDERSYTGARCAPVQRSGTKKDKDFLSLSL